MNIPEIDDIATRNAKHGPNFKLIVILAGVAILAVLLGAYLMFDMDGMHLIPKPDHTKASTSQLTPPAPLTAPAVSLFPTAQLATA